MEDFKKLPKMQHFKTGGSVKAYTKRDRKETDAADIKQDKAIVKKAFKMHDKQEHPGEKTDLSKLKKGGRAKKEVGTVKKYKCGGGVKKMADGSSVEKAALLNALPGKVNEIERAQMAARAKNALKYLGPAQQSEFVKQGGMNPAPTNVGAPAGSTVPAGQKKGGKVKKYAEGSSVVGDDVLNAIKSGKVKPVPMPSNQGNEEGVNVPGIGRVKPVPMPQLKGNDGVDVPGIGKIKPVPMKTRGDLQLLKKGGKAKK